MKILNLFFQSIIFWQLAFSPVAIANVDNSNIAVEYNKKKFDGQKQINFLKKYNNPLYLKFSDYLKRNGVINYNNIPSSKIEYIKDLDYDVIIENKHFTVTLLNPDSFKITHNSKSTTINTTDNNIEQWINNINDLGINTTTFNIFDFFINDAHALAYQLFIAIGVVFAAIVINKSVSEASFSKVSRQSKKSCETLELAQAIGNDIDITEINSAHTNLKKAYADKCLKKPSTNVCITANKTIECLNNYLNSGANKGQAQRGQKPQEALAVEKLDTAGNAK